MLCKRSFSVKEKREVNMREIYEDIGIRIKNYRIMKGLTLESLAKRTHISRSALSRYENGKANPSLDVLYLLADIFSVVPSDLIEGKSPDHKQKLSAKVSCGQLYMHCISESLMRTVCSFVTYKGDADSGEAIMYFDVGDMYDPSKVSKTYKGEYRRFDSIAHFYGVNIKCNSDVVFVIAKLDSRNEPSSGFTIYLDSVKDDRPCCLFTIFSRVKDPH